MEDTVTLDTPGPKEHLPGPRSCTITLTFSVDTKAQERTEKCPGPHVKPLPPSIGSPQGSAPLTGAQAEACAPQLATGQGPMVPERELSTGLAQVSRTEAIINHGVIERGAEAASHHPCPLAAGLAVIRQHQTVGGWAGVKWPPPHPPQNQQVTKSYPYFLIMSMSSGSCLRTGLKPSVSWDLCANLLSDLLPLKVTTPIHRTPE